MPVFKCWQANYKVVVTMAITAKYLPIMTYFSIQFLSKAEISIFSSMYDVSRRHFVTIGEEIYHYFLARSCSNVNLK